jgi:hypothetical protein
MPLTLPSYTDGAGNTYPASIWHVQELTILPGQRLARVVFAGHKDAACLAAGRKPIDVKLYILRGAEFDAFRADYRTPNAPHVEHVAEAHAMATADVQPPTPANAKEPPAKVSFFAGAVQS